MKPIGELSVLFLASLAFTASAPAQERSPREQFQSAMAAYEKTPAKEAALKVIELYKQLDPPPAVPEESRRPFVMGATVLKKANDKAGAVKAVDYFTEAVKTAPWFAEAYYNRALAREIAGQFTQAIDDLRLYLAFSLSDAERREAQDKIYSLEADAQLDAAKQAEEQKAATAKATAQAAAERERLRPTIEGKWSMGGGYIIFQVLRSGDQFSIVGGNQLFGVKPPTTWRARDVIADREHIRFLPISDNSGVHFYPVELSLSSDGGSLKGWFLRPGGDKSPADFIREP